MNTKVTIIAIVASNGAIGRDGDQPFHISADFKHFKAVTMGKPVVMGRRTFEALPCGALPGRRNIVITRNKQWRAPGAETACSIEDALNKCGDVPEVMIIGGGQVYKSAMPLASRLEITRVDAPVEDADTFFPEISGDEWRVAEQSEPMTDPRSSHTFRFITYVRKDS
ncbi:dihydrofolate reductase [Bacteroides sp. CAG:927]|jgi:dihydrofolate reductase|nr:dihydrofolate reductase [Bacteroides sp. CAG:927]